MKNDSKLKLIFFVNEFPPGPGGIGAQAYHLVKYFHKREMEIRVHTASRSLFPHGDFDRSQPFEVCRYEATSSWLSKYCSFIGFLLRHAKSATHFLVSGSSQLALVPFVQILSSSPIIAITHGHELLMVRGLKRRFLTWALGRTHAIVAVSEFSKGNLSDYLPRKHIRVIPNGIQVDGVRCEGGRSVVSRTKPVRLITVGSITARKGQHHVVQALPEIMQIVGEVEYHLVGMPENLNNILELANEYGVLDCIRAHGVVSDSQRDALLRESDVFLMLSENLPNGDVEGFGIAVLEANLLGLPAIGSLNTGVEQAVANGRSGILVHATDKAAIGRAIEQILDDYDVFSAQAIAWAKEHDWRIIGQQYLEVIENAG